MWAGEILRYGRCSHRFSLESSPEKVELVYERCYPASNSALIRASLAKPGFFCQANICLFALRIASQLLKCYLLRRASSQKPPTLRIRDLMQDEAKTNAAIRAVNFVHTA